MKVKLSYLDCFDSQYENIDYKIYQFVNPITFDVINGVNLDLKVKLIPYDIYLCIIERKGKKWRVTSVEKID